MVQAMKFSKNSPKLLPVFWVLFIFAIAVIAWSIFFKLEKSIVAVGEVSPEGRSIKVQSTYEGTISEAFIKVGDLVDTNDIILRLDTKQQKLKLSAIERQLEFAIIKTLRLKSTLNSLSPFANKSDVASEYFAIQKQIYDSEKASFRLQIESIKQKIDANQIKLNLLKSRLPIVRNAIKLAEKKFELVNEMYAKGYDGDINLLTMEAELNDTFDQEVTLKNEILLAENDIAQLTNEIGKTTQDRQLEAALNIDQIRTEIENFEGEINEITLFLKESYIASPIAGVVSRVLFENVGQFLQPGTTLVEIIPSKTQNVFYVELPISSISEVQIGQSGRISLANMDPRKNQKLTGFLKELDGDVSIAEDGRKYYSGVVEFREKFSPFLVPGVAGDISLNLGKRSVFVYIFDPIIDVIKNSLRE